MERDFLLFFFLDKKRLIAAVFECFYVKPGFFFFFFRAYLHENTDDNSLNSDWEEWEEGRKNKVAEQTGRKTTISGGTS